MLKGLLFINSNESKPAVRLTDNDIVGEWCCDVSFASLKAHDILATLSFRVCHGVGPRHASTSAPTLPASELPSSLTRSRADIV